MKKLIFALAIPVLAGLGSCAKYVDGLDASPNSPTVGTPPVLLTATQVATFGNSHFQLSRTAGILTQQLAGVQSQSESISEYAILEGDLTNEWQVLYRGLVGAHTLINTAGESNKNYRGIGKVLKAINLGIGSDFWGDIPNSEAYQGAVNLNPKYDSQEAIYTEIQSLLNSAIVDLRSQTNNITPGDDDLIYAGDTDKWIGAAFAIKARHAMRLSKRGGSNVSDALRFIDSAQAKGFSSTANEMLANYTATGGSQNPWYTFQRERNGYIKAGAYLVDLMNTISDPRRDFYFDTVGTNAGAFVGSPLGSSVITSTAQLGSFYASPSSKLPIISFVETKFIEAEAAFRTGDLTRAANAHNDAIKAHVLQVTGSADATYEANQASETSASITLAKIMTHKYVAGFTSSEVWHDWRRTGIPALTKDPRATALNEIPRHMPIVIGERLYNSNSPRNITLVSRMWWDQ